MQSAIRQDTRHFDAFWMMDLEGKGGIHTLRKSTNSGTINNSLWKLQQQQLYHPFKRQASNSPNHWAPYLLKASRVGIHEKSPEIHRHSPELLSLGFLIAEILENCCFLSLKFICAKAYFLGLYMFVLIRIILNMRLWLKIKVDQTDHHIFVIFSIGGSMSGVL